MTAGVLGRRIRVLRRYRYLYLMAVPVLLFYALFHYSPMYGLIIAFKDYNVFKGILGSPWAGLYNFELVFDFITNWDQELKDAYDNDQVVINPAYGRTLLAMDEVGSKPNDIFWKYYNAFLLGEIEPNDENWAQMKKEYWDAGYDRLEKELNEKYYR